MKLKVTIFVFILLFSNMQRVASAEENEYGIVKAWFDEKNATVETIEGIKLKINEPFDVRVEIESKINGHVTLTPIFAERLTTIIEYYLNPDIL